MMLKLSLLLLLLSHSTLSMLLGWVESPGYPRGYPPHASLNWSRCAPKGHTLSIELIHLDLEDSHDCEDDAVKVFADGRLISALCGKVKFEELQLSVNPTLRSSPGGCLSLTFHSDTSNTRRHTGFKGFYTIRDFDECEDDPNNECTQFCHNYIGGYHCSCRHGYHLDNNKHTCTVRCSEDLSGLLEGDVSSPSWPRPYAENADCRSKLSVEAHLQLELSFSDQFDVEQSPNGECIDALRIETPSQTFGPFCGNTPPPSPFLTHSNHVTVRFTSDSFGTNQGFSLHFRTKAKVCTMVPANFTVSPQKTQYERGQTVIVTCDVGYVTNANGIHALMSQYEATCQSTGTWAPSYTCEPVNCGKPQIPQNSILQMVGPKTPKTLYEDQVQFNCSSTYYTLEGDDTYICNASGDWVSVNGETKMPKCTAVCGRPEIFMSSAGRIIGGANAKLGTIPWHLLIKSPRGGASLINDQWVVTAAHVVEGMEEGSLRLYGGLVDGMAQTQRDALTSARIIIHPGYRKSPTNLDNDIALVKLTQRVKFGPNLLPICLPEAGRVMAENDIGTVSGWGTTEITVISRWLKFADIGIYSLDTCRQTPLNAENKNMVFTDNMICAGDVGKDSCLKDSGGPFFLPSLSAGRGPFYLAGIVSWGAPCELKQYKGYYTKVGNYIDWITSTIETVDQS